MNENNTEDLKLKIFLLDKTAKIRVHKKVATQWLLENKTITIGATVYWLEIKDIGLSVCEITLAPRDMKETKIVYTSKILKK
jgi:hypothetical protein